MRFEFLDFEIDAPSAGVCSNSTLTFSGADAVTMAVLPSNLCGTLTGQHIHISTKETNEIKMKISLGALGTQRWNILLRAYDDSQTSLLAPRGCLQYHRNNSILHIHTHKRLSKSGFKVMSWLIIFTHEFYILLWLDHRDISTTIIQ